MTSANLDNLAKIGQLKKEPPDRAELTLSLAALRRHGYRSENRYLVFQVLPHTLGIEDSEWRVLATCHERRNRAEYQGILETDERLLAALVEIGARLLAALEAPGKTKNR